MGRHWMDNPAVRERLLQRIPLGRIADARRFARPVHFVFSPASLVTGQVLSVDSDITAANIGPLPPIDPNALVPVMGQIVTELPRGAGRLTSAHELAVETHLHKFDEARGSDTAAGEVQIDASQAHLQ
jgi:hypothetical protein